MEDRWLNKQTSHHSFIQYKCTEGFQTVTFYGKATIPALRDLTDYLFPHHPQFGRLRRMREQM